MSPQWHAERATPLGSLLCVQHLGVMQLSRQAVVARHVLPRAADLPEPALAAVVLPVLKQMAASPQVSDSPESISSAIYFTTLRFAVRLAVRHVSCSCVRLGPLHMTATASAEVGMGHGLLYMCAAGGTRGSEGCGTGGCLCTDCDGW